MEKIMILFMGIRSFWLGLSIDFVDKDPVKILVKYKLNKLKSKKMNITFCLLNFFIIVLVAKSR